jgi:serine/threonine-protein kinase SRPK3
VLLACALNPLSVNISVLGDLLRVDELFHISIEKALANYEILPQDEIMPAATFIRECIRLDPIRRPSAESLLNHPWLQ